MNELKDLKRKIKNYQEKSPEDVKKGLEIAKHIEKSSLNFYTKKIKEFDDQSLKNLLEMLKKQEEKHLEIINNLLNNGKWENARQKLDTEEKPNILPKIKGGEEERELLLEARKAEKVAQSFYEKMAQNSKNEIKKFFTHLAKFEKGHFELMDELFETITDVSEYNMG